MTAEVAILNKTAVALAADSAVTISAGNDQQKIFDSADKLFELSCDVPIAAMISGDMSFAEIPLEVLIKNFRAKNLSFDNVEAAAQEFLRYLSDYSTSASTAVKLTSLDMLVRPWFERVKERVQNSFISKIMRNDGEGADRDWGAVRRELLSEQILVAQTALQRIPDAETIGGNGEDENLLGQKFSELVEEVFEDEVNEEHVDALKILFDIIISKPVGQSYTGLVVAGFGKDEMFPTLYHYELHGIIGAKLKYIRCNVVDIDRGGMRAKVLPFAQKEMVERFLYGLDDGIRNAITQFCNGALPQIRESILGKLEMAAADLEALSDEAKGAENEFLQGLVNESFDVIRENSELEIEGMVEFMPKPELARMAEALVNLTSIKRRVTRGLETVGGPIDVAVISKSEGFVWVSRKHYFPPELNQRFFARKRSEMNGGTDA